MKTPSNGVIGLLLAGGQGRRVGGRDKGLLPWRGRPLAAWGYQALAAVTPQVFISANRSLPDYERLAPGHLLPDPDSVRGQGPLAGLLAGLGAATAAGARAVLVCPCDTPGITPAVLASLLTAWQAQPDRPVIAEHRGRRHPLHGVYPVALAEALARRLRAGERRARGFAEAMAARPVICAAPEAVFRNLNRWRDLEPPGA